MFSVLRVLLSWAKGAASLIGVSKGELPDFKGSRADDPLGDPRDLVSPSKKDKPGMFCIILQFMRIDERMGGCERRPSAQTFELQVKIHHPLNTIRFRNWFMQKYRQSG